MPDWLRKEKKGEAEEGGKGREGKGKNCSAFYRLGQPFVRGECHLPEKKKSGGVTCSVFFFLIEKIVPKLIGGTISHHAFDYSIPFRPRLNLIMHLDPISLI